MHRRRANILIFKMCDRLLVADGRVQIGRGLFPFQFSAGSRANKDRQCEGEDASFHFFE